MGETMLVAGAPASEVTRTIVHVADADGMRPLHVDGVNLLNMSLAFLAAALAALTQYLPARARVPYFFSQIAGGLVLTIVAALTPLLLSGAVTLAWQAGKVLQVNEIGYRDVDAGLPMQRDTIFRIASMTKPVTVAAAMTLVEQGRLALRDPVTHWLPELADRQVGEIWLHGDNIGRGYWGRPEETHETFGVPLASRLGEGSHANGAPAGAGWLRTGDLGFYLDGELYVTGRLADLVTVDGHTFYPQDIEATAAAASPSVRAGFVAAFSVPAAELPASAGAPAGGAGERLVIVAERGPGAGKADPGPIVEAIRAAVSRHHALPVADVRLVAAGAIPRTTSGKLARRACRAEYLAGVLGKR